MIPSFSYVRPQSLKEVLAQNAGAGSAILAGGTDLLGCLRDGVFSVDKVVSMSRVPHMAGVAQKAAGPVIIGAMTTIGDVAANPLVQAQFPMLAKAAQSVASPQLRNQGTIGGNLCQKPRCWYYRGEFACLRKGGSNCFALGGQNQYHAIFGHDQICCIVHPSDTAPALVALNARLKTVGPAGSREIPLEQFFVLPKQDVKRETVLKPGEVVTEVQVPRQPEGLKGTYRKVRVRGAWDFAIAGVAVAIGLKGDTVASARIVLSGAAPVPWRAVEAEAAIVGKRINQETAAKAGAAATAQAEPLEHNEYKVPLFQSLVEQSLLEVAGG